MKRYARLICIVTIVALLLAVPAQAVTNEEVAPWSSSYFTSISTYLLKVSSLRFQIWFDITATRTMDELGVTSIEVQRSADGVAWTTMKTFLPEDYPQMMDANSGSHVDCVYYTGTPGYYYRAHVTFYAKRGNGLGELYRYTDVLKM